MSATGTPAPAASEVNVSPGRTVYAPWTAGAAAPSDGATSTPPAALPESAICVPAIRNASGASPFAAASDATERPFAAATPVSVSPGCTR
jgi:hypothetical protein